MRGRRRQRRVRLLDSERANAAFTKRDGASSGPNRLTTRRATKLGLLDLKRHLFLGLGITLCDADMDLIRSRGEFVCGQICDVRNAAVW